ncbi:phenylalanine--tRNA ligase subunit alpha, partial [Candidatus Bipolaricaulota bacterium]|nr:phenylalanine--tRNA ligase subunit alpha [Candidatus Bipolaricaulota bacterium]
MTDLILLREQIEKINADLKQGIDRLTDRSALEAFRIEFLGRKGRIGQLLRLLGQIDADEKAEAGKLLNDLKTSANAAFEERRSVFETTILQSKIEEEKVDLTLPGVYHPVGHRHLLTQVQQEIESIFLR